MINIKGIIDDIFIIISKKQTLFEFLLNLSFVLIIFAIIVIFYWDSINRSIIHNSRCKVSIDNSDITYNLNVSINKDNDNANLFNISYDNSKEKNVKIECACPIGEQINKFNIPFYNTRDNKVEELNKYCYCEKDYQYNSDEMEKLNLDGDAFMIDYYGDLFSKYAGGNNYSSISLEFPEA